MKDAVFSRNSNGDRLRIAAEKEDYRKLKRHRVAGRTDSLRFEFSATNGVNRIQIYSIRVY